MASKTKNVSQIHRWERSLEGNYGTPTISLVRGKGCDVWDADGKKYLDFLGGIATNLLGHAHPRVIAAVTKQMKTLSHVSNFYAHPNVLELAEKLQAMTGDKSARVFFCNSGAEANEAAFGAGAVAPGPADAAAPGHRRQSGGARRLCGGRSRQARRHADRHRLGSVAGAGRRRQARVGGHQGRRGVGAVLRTVRRTG